MKKLPVLSDARERLDKNVKSLQARALGSVRVAWGDLVVIRDALIAGEALARQATETVRELRRFDTERRTEDTGARPGFQRATRHD